MITPESKSSVFKIFCMSFVLFSRFQISCYNIAMFEVCDRFAHMVFGVCTNTSNQGQTLQIWLYFIAQCLKYGSQTKCKQIILKIDDFNSGENYL